jgi:hypothetical protein
MRLLSQLGWPVIVGVLVLASTGCSTSSSGSASAPPTAGDDLLEVSGLLRDYTAEFRKGPARVADLQKNEPLYTRGFQAVRTGAVVVVWGVPMPAEGGGDGVIAYEKKAETDGGAVLLQNGTVKQMTADEFRSAAKAR